MIQPTALIGHDDSRRIEIRAHLENHRIPAPTAIDAAALVDFEDEITLSDEWQAEWYDSRLPAPERECFPPLPTVAVRLGSRRTDGTWPRHRITAEQVVADRAAGIPVLTSWDQFDPTDHHLYPRGLVLLDPVSL